MFIYSFPYWEFFYFLAILWVTQAFTDLRLPIDDISVSRSHGQGDEVWSDLRYFKYLYI